MLGEFPTDDRGVFAITPEMLQAWTPTVSALSLLAGAHIEAFQEAHASTRPGRRVKYIRVMRQLIRIAGYLRGACPRTDPAHDISFFAETQGQAHNHAEAYRQIKEGYQMGRITKKTCRNCGDEFERAASAAQHSALVFCSRSCYYEKTFGLTEQAFLERAETIDAMLRGGWTQAAVGAKFGITRQRVKAIHDAYRAETPEVIA
jgi:hypothetical protein